MLQENSFARVGRAISKGPSSPKSIRVVVKIFGPLLGILNIRCRIIIGIQTGSIILTTTHMYRHRPQNI